MIKGGWYLAGLHPAFKGACEYALDVFDSLGLQPIVTSGFRTFDEQRALYAKGRTMPGEIVTKALPGESAHNWGLAIDVTTSYGYDSPQQREIHNLFGKLGFKTISWDLPHGEHPAFGGLLKQLRASGFTPG